MLQVLWERGNINDKKVTNPRIMSYSKDGKGGDLDTHTDLLLNECKQYSLVWLLSNVEYFTREKIDLEMLALDVSKGVDDISSVLLTPKFYCELADKDIEYS